MENFISVDKKKKTIVPSTDTKFKFSDNKKNPRNATNFPPLKLFASV